MKYCAEAFSVTKDFVYFRITRYSPFYEAFNSNANIAMTTNNCLYFWIRITQSSSCLGDICTYIFDVSFSRLTFCLSLCRKWCGGAYLMDAKDPERKLSLIGKQNDIIFYGPLSYDLTSTLTVILV